MEVEVVSNRSSPPGVLLHEGWREGPKAYSGEPPLQT